MCKIPQIACFLIFCSVAAYGTAEYGREDMIRRARTSLEEILSTEEFKAQDLQPPWWSKWAERIFRRLSGESEWLGVMLEWLFYLVVVLVIISSVALIARRFRKWPSLRTSYDVSTEPQRLVDTDSARAEAYECYQRGEYRQAVRYLYLSLLLYLDKAGSLTYDAGKTNGEYVGEVRSSISDKAERFASLTLLFERKWYGMERTSVGDFQQCEAIFAALTGEKT